MVFSWILQWWRLDVSSSFVSTALELGGGRSLFPNLVPRVGATDNRVKVVYVGAGPSGRRTIGGALGVVASNFQSVGGDGGGCTIRFRVLAGHGPNKIPMSGERRYSSYISDPSIHWKK